MGERDGEKGAEAESKLPRKKERGDWGEEERAAAARNVREAVAANKVAESGEGRMRTPSLT